MRLWHKGFTVIELAIVLAITTIVMAMAFGGYGRLNKNNETLSTQMEMQTNLRLALSFLERDIRMAGWNGECERSSEANAKNCDNLDNNLKKGTYVAFFGAFGGVVNSGQTWLDFDLNGEIDTSVDVPLNNNAINTVSLPGTDAIQIGRTDEVYLPISDCNGSSVSARLMYDYNNDGVDEYYYLAGAPDCIVSYATGERILCEGEITVLQGQDCATCDISKVTNLVGNSASIFNAGTFPNENQFCQAVSALCDGASACGTLAKFRSYIYYIRNDADGIPKLVRRDTLLSEEVIAEGIEDMQFTYFVAADNTAMDYSATTDDVLRDYGQNGVFRVRMVRVTLVARTKLAGAEGEKISAPISIPGHTRTEPIDSYIRRAITSQIRTRCLIPGAD